MQIDLIIRKNSEPKTYTVTCDIAGRVVFGRNHLTSPADFEGSQISREHFALFSRKGAVYVENLSSNGTFVNGSLVPRSKPKKLNSGDVLGVPGYEIELERQVPQPTSKPIRPAIPEPKPKLSDFMLSFSAWELIVLATVIGSFVLIVYYFTH